MEGYKNLNSQKLKPIMIVYMLLAHLAGLYGLYLFLMGRISLTTMIFGSIYLYFNQIGVTAGMHRLWSHRSYTAKWPLRLFLMCCASIANQGSIYHWVRDHRIHHKFSEKSADPHNANLGFFYSHVGWLLVEKNYETVNEGKKLNLDDLHNDPFVMWEKNAHPWFQIFMCYILPGIVCSLLGDTYWNGVFFAGALRYVLSLHFTWFVNSVAHMWGDRPYNSKIGPAENMWVSIFAVGEGWHNFHHTYPFDYATSEYGVFSQWNPTKLFIDISSFVGLATNRRKATVNRNKLNKIESAQQQDELGY